jgi:hypothetical protein
MFHRRQQHESAVAWRTRTVTNTNVCVNEASLFFRSGPFNANADFRDCSIAVLKSNHPIK